MVTVNKCKESFFNLSQPIPTHLKQPPHRCPECGGKNLFYERRERELVCQDCGLVLMGQHPYVAGRVKIKYPFGLGFEEENYY